MTEFERGYDYCLYIIMQKIKSKGGGISAAFDIVKFIEQENAKSPRRRMSNKNNPTKEPV